MEQIDWSENTRIRQHTPTTPWRYIQGNKPVQGKLIGGCFDSLMECMIGTDLFPPVQDFENTVLFIETSEERPTSDMVKYWLRIFGTNGILAKLNGILFGRPGGEFNASEQKEKEKYLDEMTRFDDVFLQVCREYDRTDLPIVTNMDFGHQVPQLILPFGATVEINPLKKTVSILDSAVV